MGKKIHYFNSANYISKSEVTLAWNSTLKHILKRNPGVSFRTKLKYPRAAQIEMTGRRTFWVKTAKNHFDPFHFHLHLFFLRIA